MLRESATATKTPIDLSSITDPAVDPLIDGGRELLAFTTALVGGDAQSLDPARSQLSNRLGTEATAAAAGAAGNFQMMNRLLDATGVPKPRDHGLEAELGLGSGWADHP